MSNFDRWLEAPYVAAAAEAEAFYAYCDERDIDPYTTEAEEAWQAHCDAIDTANDLRDFPRPPAVIRWCCDCGDAPAWLGSDGSETCQPCDTARREARDEAFFVREPW